MRVAWGLFSEKCAQNSSLGAKDNPNQICNEYVNNDLI